MNTYSLPVAYLNTIPIHYQSEFLECVINLHLINVYKLEIQQTKTYTLKQLNENETIWVIDFLSSRKLQGRDYLTESIKVFVLDLQILTGQLTNINV